MTSASVRAGDSDREAAVTALGDHYAAGRLTKEEFDERADAAWTARTRADLSVLFADLPRPATYAAPAPPTPPTPAPMSRPGRHLGWLPPLLVVMAVLVVVTHAPFFLLLGLVWVVLARGHRRGPWHGHQRWAGYRG